jgi:phage head maturation protease
MNTRRKTTDLVLFKALGADEPDGTFEAVVSVFNNRDAHGDIVRPGAYKDTIAAMKRSKTPWPVVFSHRHADLEAIVGSVLDAAEIKGTDPRIPANAPPALKAGGGLWVKGRMADLTEDFTAKLWARMKDGRVVQWSFAYDVVDGGYVVEGEVESFELRKLTVLEVGPALLGANDATRTLAMKARDAGKPELAKAIDLVGSISATVAELELDPADLDLDAALEELEELTVVEEVTETVTTELDLELDLDELGAAVGKVVADAVTAALAKRSATDAGGDATVTGATTDGKDRGKGTDDRQGGKASDDRGSDDRTATGATSVSLVGIEAFALEAGLTP